MAHPGVANDFGAEDAKKYYTYYQWVCFVLFFQVGLHFILKIFVFICELFGQALACYVPKVMWDVFEGGLMKMLSMRLKFGICHEEEKNKKKEIILDYLLTHVTVSWG